MKYIDVYRNAYRMLGDYTPLSGLDCGKLCKNACCRGEKNTGMYLFPGEDVLYQGSKGIKIVPSKLKYDRKTAKILLCGGRCRREERPLSCRLFPLCLHIEQGTMRLLLDPRAYMLCPLAAARSLKLIDKEFIIRVRRVYRYLSLFPEVRLFLEELSKEAEEYMRFY